MEPEDFLEPEVAVIAGVVAAICSPRARKFLRKGLVYSTAGALIAGDTITIFAKKVGKGAKHAGGSMLQSTRKGMKEAREKASSAANGKGQENAQEREHVGVQGEGATE